MNIFPYNYKIWTFSALFAVVLLNIGCSSFDDTPNYHVELLTDQTVYETPVSITLSVANHSERALSYVCYGVIRLEELEGDTIINSWLESGHELCGMAANAIGSGETEVRAFDLRHTFGGEPREDARFDETVEYRFRFELYGEAVPGEEPYSYHYEPLSDDNRLSNRFMVLARE